MGENAELMRRWFRDVWRPGGEATVDELLSSGVTGLLENRELHSRQDFHDMRRLIMAVFPDIAVDLDDVIEQGEKVAVKWRATATHAGDGLGVPATGKKVAFRGMTWVEIRNGQIARGWDAWNLGALLQSLGVSPAAGVS
jgi:steroid delta-isomerase-like uncharacterized protein